MSTVVFPSNFKLHVSSRRVPILSLYGRRRDDYCIGFLAILYCDECISFLVIIFPSHSALENESHGKSFIRSVLKSSKLRTVFSIRRCFSGHDIYKKYISSNNFLAKRNKSHRKLTVHKNTSTKKPLKNLSQRHQS